MTEEKHRLPPSWVEHLREMDRVVSENTQRVVTAKAAIQEANENIEMVRRHMGSLLNPIAKSEGIHREGQTYQLSDDRQFLLFDVRENKED